MKKTILITGLCALAISFSATTQAKIYKWKDSKGVVHYSATPPPQKVKTKRSIENIEDKIRFAAGKYRPSAKTASKRPTSNRESANQEEKNNKLSAPSKKLVSFCKNQRKNLATLKSNYQNVWVEVDGKEQKLDQKQRQEKVNYLIKAIKDNCEGV